MPTVRVNDCDLYFEQAGAGPPLVLVHGLWCTGRFFREQVGPFSERFRTITLDLRSHGRSEATGWGNTVGQHARDLHGFLEALELESTVVLGWSMGFLILLDYFQQFPAGRIRAAVDVDQGPSDFRWPDWPDGPFDLAALRHFHAGVQQDQEGTARSFVPMLFATPPAQEMQDWLVSEVMLGQPAPAAAILVDQTLADYRETLADVPVPTLLCIGRTEGVVTISAAKLMHERIPDATLEIFEHSNHCPFLEEPRRFNQVVTTWIEALP